MTDHRPGSLVDRDPDRVPGAPPGYRPVSGSLGSCDRCGAVVDVEDLQAKRDHERCHQALRAMWAAARSSSPPTPPQEAHAPMEAGRGGVEGANEDTKPGAAPHGASTPPGGTSPPPGGTKRAGRGQAGHGKVGDAPAGTDDDWWTR